MSKKTITVNVPLVKVTAKHALFDEFCSHGQYATTHCAPLFFNNDGSLVAESISAIKSIIFDALDEASLSKQRADQFIEYIRIQSLAKSDWPFCPEGPSARNVGEYNFTLTPSVDADGI